MSTLTDTSQRAKKKMAPLSRTGTAKPRGSQTTASTASDTSQNASQTPVRDPYDYDFVDEAAPAPRTVAKPRPFSNTKPASKSTSASSTASLAASPMPASSTPKRPYTGQRSTIVRGTAEAARSLKRKPSYLDATPSQRPLTHAATSSASTSRPQQAKRVQRQPPSPKPAGLAASPPLYKQARAVGKDAAAQPAQASPARQRVTKTPPRNTVRIKSPSNMRSPSPSPRKTPGASVAKGILKLQPTPTASGVPYRAANGMSPGNTPKRALGSVSSSTSATADKPATNKTAATPRQPPPRATPAARTTYTPTAQTTTQRKRRRLIDTLVDQREESSSSSEEEKDSQQTTAEAGDDDGSSEADTILSKYKNIGGTPGSDEHMTFMELESIVTGSPSKPASRPSATPSTVSRTQQSRRKYVYNVQRTMLAENPDALGGPQGSDLSMLESLLPDPEPKQDAYDMDDDTGTSQGAIQSIHELRQAGANSRYADELVDIMDRVGAPSVGKPNSARRGALIELATKLQEKTFLRQFRDQGADLKMFCSVGKETDTIAGYTIACIVVVLFSSNSVSPHLLREFQQHKIKDLFALLLEVDKDIEAVTKSRDPRDRKNRTSPHMSQQLVGLRDALKKNLLIWKPATVAPSKLSPRTVTLKALHMFAQQLQAASGGVITGLDEDDGALSASLTKELFGILSSALPSLDDDAYDFDDFDDFDDGKKTADAASSVLATGLSSNPTSVDVYLVLSLLEMHSVSAMQSDISAEWTRNYLPVIAGALSDSLVRHQTEQEAASHHRLNDLELLVLKLALNTANNNPDGARYYVVKGLLRQLAELSAGSLAAVVRAAKTGEDYASGALNELLLMLGVMINFSENDPAAGETLAQGGGGLVLLGKLGKTFLDGRAIAAEADSEEKSQLNVAFAYLSILLGYLCLHEPINQAFRQLSPSRSLNPLLESIRHFVNLHDQLGKAENTEHGAEAGHFTARLRALAHELEVRAY